MEGAMEFDILRKGKPSCIIIVAGRHHLHIAEGLLLEEGALNVAIEHIATRNEKKGSHQESLANYLSAAVASSENNSTSIIWRFATFISPRMSGLRRYCQASHQA